MRVLRGETHVDHGRDGLGLVAGQGVDGVLLGLRRHAAVLDGKPQEAIDRLASMAPLERLGTPEDVAEVIAFLAGPARWVDGQVRRADGGIA